jgi:hypothetical protein
LKIKDQFPMVSAFALSQARVIVRYAPELADRVLQTKGLPFAEAFEKARQRRAETEETEEKLAGLRAELSAKSANLANLEIPVSGLYLLAAPHRRQLHQRRESFRESAKL